MTGCDHEEDVGREESGLPGHLLVRVTEERMEVDQIMRSLGKAEYAGSLKQRVGVKPSANAI